MLRYVVGSPRRLRQSALIEPRRTRQPGGRAGAAGLSSGVDRRSLAYADANGNRHRDGEAEHTCADPKCNDGAIGHTAGAAFANAGGAKPSRALGARAISHAFPDAAADSLAHSHSDVAADPLAHRHGRPDSYADGDSPAHAFANPDPGAHGPHGHSNAGADPLAHHHAATATG